jgi:hypothetical protein
MKARRRSQAQRDVDKAEILRLVRKGFSQSMLAEHFKVSLATIRNDWRRVMLEVQQCRKDDFDATKEAILEQIADVKREALEAWEASKAVDDQPDEEDADGATEKERKPGQNEFLRTRLDCLKAEREILAIDEPAQRLQVEAGESAGLVSFLDALLPVVKQAIEMAQAGRAQQSALPGPPTIVIKPEV